MENFNTREESILKTLRWRLRGDDAMTILWDQGIREGGPEERRWLKAFDSLEAKGIIQPIREGWIKLSPNVELAAVSTAPYFKINRRP